MGKLPLQNMGRSRYLMSRTSEYKRAPRWVVASGLQANSGLAEVIWKTLFSVGMASTDNAAKHLGTNLQHLPYLPVQLQGYFSQSCQLSWIVPLCDGFAMWKSVQEGPLSTWEESYWVSGANSVIDFYLFIILFIIFLRQLIQGTITVGIFLQYRSQLTMQCRDACLFHMKPRYGALLSSHYWTEADLTLEMEIQIVMSHSVYPSIIEKTMKCSAYRMIYKSKALRLLILNHSDRTMYRQADYLGALQMSSNLLFKYLREVLKSRNLLCCIS